MEHPLKPGGYVLDQTHTQIGFVVTHLGITPIRGMFTDFNGRLDVGESPEASSLEVTVALASLQSSHPGREQHVQGEDFFDSERHPMMTFSTSQILGSGDKWTMTGPLTLRGASVPVSLEATLTGRTVFPMDNKEHIGFVASGVVSRLAFGVASQIPSFMLSDDIQLDLSVQLVPE